MHAEMFDPLDFISNESSSFHSPEGEDNTSSLVSNTECSAAEVVIETDGPVIDDIDIDAPIQVIDLPYVQLAPSEVVLTVLLLLKPGVSVNFGQEKRVTKQSSDSICKEKNIPPKYLKATVKWYEHMGNLNLNSKDKICTKIPRLGICQSSPELLGYYTNILSKYNKMDSNDKVVENILQEVSCRISEKCGRTAQPSMTREFQIDNLNCLIKLHEPSLTSDNLGLKTWGASLILSQKICSNFPQIKCCRGSKRVLELGAGTGLVGIAFAHKSLEIDLHSQYVIYLTDLPEILPNLRKNVEINDLNVTGKVHADVLDWTNSTPFVEKYGGDKFDMILIADPIYSPEHPKWVVDMIVEFLAKSGKVFLEVPVRAKYSKERQQLWDLLESHGLCGIVEEIDEGLDDWGNVKYIYKEIVWKST